MRQDQVKALLMALASTAYNSKFIKERKTSEVKMRMNEVASPMPRKLVLPRTEYNNVPPPLLPLNLPSPTTYIIYFFICALSQENHFISNSKNTTQHQLMFLFMEKILMNNSLFTRIHERIIMRKLCTCHIAQDE
jgi:hypothetical protein